LLFYYFRKKKLVIVYNKTELVSLSVIFIASLVMLYIIISLPHVPTPDEDYYITNARLLLNYGQAFPISSTAYWTENLVALFTSRTQWVSIIASFFYSANVSPLYSDCVSLIFLSGMCVASLLLIPERHRDYALIVTIPILVFSNIVLTMLSGFALNDLAVAFYDVASLLFFINSFKENSGKIELSARNLFMAIMLQSFVLLIKFDIIFTIPFVLVLVVYIFRFRLYRSAIGKIITVLAMLPVLYEFAIDIPRNVALYVFKTRALEFLAGFLPVSPVESLILLFISTPYSQITVFSYAPLDYLWRFYVVFSPENLTILIASMAIFLPFLLRKAPYAFKFKNMVLITLLAMLLQFVQAIQSGDWFDVPRYYASVIAPLTVACIILYFDWIRSKLYMMLVPLAGMLFLAWSNIVLTGQYGGVPISWNAGLTVTLSVLVLQIVAYTTLTLALFFLMTNKAVRIFKPLGTITRSLKLQARKVAFLILILIAVAGNLYFGSIAYANSPSVRDYGLSALTTVANQGIVFSNSYALGTYSSNSLFRGGFISSMPSAEEFNSLIESMPNGTGLVLFNNSTVTSLSESFVGSYPRLMAGEAVIPPSNSIVWPADTVYSGNIFHAFFLNGTSNVKVGDSEVEPTFTNISWEQYSNGTVPYFSGSGGFIEIPYSPILNMTPPYTIETWVNYEPISGQDAVILDASTELGGYMLIIRDGKLVFSNGFNNSAVATALTVEPDVWTYIVVSYNGTQSIFYVNGESETVTGPQYKPMDVAVPIWLGRYHWAFASEVYFKGVIGVVNIYNRLLSSEEVSSNYASAFQPPYFELSEEISSSNGDAFVYELLSPEPLNFSSDEDITVNRFSWSVENASSPIPDIVLSLNISSKKYCNATIVMSNDAFSRILSCEIHPGSNNISFSFESFIYENNSLTPYGSLIARSSNTLVIEDQSNVLFKGEISIFQFSSLELVCYGLLVFAIMLILLLLATRGKGAELL
jgi:hypothetical protein